MEERYCPPEKKGRRQAWKLRLKVREFLNEVVITVVDEHDEELDLLCENTHMENAFLRLKHPDTQQMRSNEAVTMLGN